MNEALSAKWAERRGIKVASVAVNSVSASAEDEAMIKELQKSAVFRNPNMAAAHMVQAQAEAMKSAAKNENGAMMGFMGMNMAQTAGGMNANALFQMGQSQQPAAPAAPASNGWTCACGAVNSGRFCTECGASKPNDGWTCACGSVNKGKFCPECGAKKPASPNVWVCACGAENKGKFCVECGAKKPAGVPQYKCDKCGWEPADPKNPPKFCPECGDSFDSADMV